MFRGRVRRAHFVGIGGIGMSGLAEILRTMEFDVSGSDLKPNDKAADFVKANVISSNPFQSDMTFLQVILRKHYDWF